MRCQNPKLGLSQHSSALHRPNASSKLNEGNIRGTSCLSDPLHAMQEVNAVQRDRKAARRQRNDKPRSLQPGLLVKPTDRTRPTDACRSDRSVTCSINRFPGDEVERSLTLQAENGAFGHGERKMEEGFSLLGTDTGIRLSFNFTAGYDTPCNDNSARG